jgi:cation:H+ antiporter
MSWMAVGLLVAGLVLLLIGGEGLVRGASALAATWGVSSLMIGLTVVAFGTSAPEMAVSLGSILTERQDMALGNVVGSNIFNVLLILGISALVSPLLVTRQLIRMEVPILIVVSLVSLAMCWSGQIGRLEGIVLVLGLFAYTAFAIRQGRKEGNAGAGSDAAAPRPNLLLQIGYIVVGLGLLAWGAEWFVEGAEQIARWLGVSELIIALTVVAGGTSLPELATSVIASMRGERDIAVGNVIGSNLFNLLGVLGVTAIVAPHGVAVAQDALDFDLPVMVAVAVICLPVFFTGSVISRWEGALFLAFYAGYIAYLVARTTSPQLHETFHAFVIWGVLPGTVLVLAVSVWQHFRQQRAGPG